MTTWLKRHFRIAVMVLIGVAVVPGCLRAFKLTTPSMAPSINIGDSFLVNKVAYRIGSPKRGDMVQLLFPGKNIPLIKRVIGLPGETIEFRENRVLINGHMLPLDALNRGDFNWVAPENNFGTNVYNEDGHWISFTPGQGQCRNHAPVRLGMHDLFLVGDNRDGSLDSRIWGPVATDRILGKVVVTYARSK